VLLVILAASLAWVLKPILLLFAIVILLAMVLNPIPFVFGQAMDLNPVSILFFTLAMSSLFGLTGAILAVPAAAMFKIAIEEFYFHRLQLNEDQIAAQAKQIIYGRGDPEKGG
jgi:predicted PurR-regulated permease PerM